jgi:lysyl-tRNA synthetase class 2
MTFTEELLSQIVKSVNGSFKLQYHPKDDPENLDKVYEIDFTPPFRRIPMMKGLEDVLGRELPGGKELATEEARVFFDKLCKELDVECPNPRSTGRLIDKLVGKYLEEQCISPCFIIDTP